MEADTHSLAALDDGLRVLSHETALTKAHHLLRIAPVCHELGLGVFNWEDFWRRPERERLNAFAAVFPIFSVALAALAAKQKLLTAYNDLDVKVLNTPELSPLVDELRAIQGGLDRLADRTSAFVREQVAPLGISSLFIPPEQNE